jgi:hypothetical protein
MLLLPLRRSRVGSGPLCEMQVAARTLYAVAPSDSGRLLRVRADALEKGAARWSSWTFGHVWGWLRDTRVAATASNLRLLRCSV